MVFFESMIVNESDVQKHHYPENHDPFSDKTGNHHNNTLHTHHMQELPTMCTWNARQNNAQTKQGIEKGRNDTKSATHKQNSNTQYKGRQKMVIAKRQHAKISSKYIGHHRIECQTDNTIFHQAIIRYPIKEVTFTTT